MKQITITMMIDDGAACPECHAPIDVDGSMIEITIGECRECGEELSLEPHTFECGQVQ